MKTAKELANYTHINTIAMREWWNKEYMHAKKLLEQWIKEFHIGSKQDNELVSDIAVYNLEGDVIIQNYIRALLKCNEKYTRDTVLEAIDILLQEMAEKLSEHMRNQYPCLQHTHYVVMRANKFEECVMYVGPYYINSESACRLFEDDGVFMTKGFVACNPLVHTIGLFQ